MQSTNFSEKGNPMHLQFGVLISKLVQYKNHSEYKSLQECKLNVTSSPPDILNLKSFIPTFSWMFWWGWEKHCPGCPNWTDWGISDQMLPKKNKYKDVVLCANGLPPTPSSIPHILMQIQNANIEYTQIQRLHLLSKLVDSSPARPRAAWHCLLPSFLNGQRQCQPSQ